jgi:hypothetical protein
VTSNFEKCSRSGCQLPAKLKLIWRNPKIHTDGRTKTWLSCKNHQAFLVDYLETRGLYLFSETME